MERLVDATITSRCTIVDAPAGYRKSELLDRVAEQSGLASWLNGPDELASLTARGRELVLVDDATPTDDSSLADLIERSLRSEPERRVVVAGRRMGSRCRQLGARPENRLVEADSLALSIDEINSRVAERVDRATAIDAAGLIHDVSHGWPALAEALVDAAAQGARSALLSSTVGLSTVSSLLGPVLEELDRDARISLSVGAQLPVLDNEILDALELSRLVEQMIDLGAPFVRRGAGELTMPPLIRDYLAGDRHLDHRLAHVVAPLLAERGHAIEAARFLYRSGGGESAASFLASLTPSTVDAVDAGDLTSMIELLGDCRERWPRLLLWQASAEGNQARLERQRTVLQQAAATTSGTDAAQVRREARAELLLGRAMDGECGDDLEDEIHRELSTSDDRRRSIRLSEALGLLWASRETCDSLEEASLLLDRAARQWEHLGEHHRASATLRLLTVQALVPLGRYVESEAAMARGSELSNDGPLDRARNAAVRARVAALAARPDVSLHLTVADDLWHALGYRWVNAYATWSRMLTEATNRRPAEVTSLHERAWTQLGELRDHSTGLIFLCESVGAMVRCGVLDKAEQLLESARPRRAENELEFDLAELTLLGRTASSAEVRARADALGASDRVPLARRWRLLLDVAVAEHREGLAHVGSLLERVLIEASLSGLDELPYRLEPEVFDHVAEHRIELGGDALPPLERGVSLAVLGGFTVRRDGNEVEIGSAPAAMLVKLLAVRGGSAPVELVIDTLWPEVDPTIGRRRLKNVLSRTRSDLGPVVIREPERISLTADVEIDLKEFDLAAKQATLLAGTDPDAASAASSLALAIYKGELLPDDRYEDWVEAARLEVRGRASALIDIVLADSQVLESPERVASVAELLLRVDSADLDLLCDLAQRCIAVGNTNTADVLVRRAQSVATDLGVEPETVLGGLEPLAPGGATDA